MANRFTWRSILERLAVGVGVVGLGTGARLAAVFLAKLLVRGLRKLGIVCPLRSLLSMRTKKVLL